MSDNQDRPVVYAYEHHRAAPLPDWMTRVMPFLDTDNPIIWSAVAADGRVIATIHNPDDGPTAVGPHGPFAEKYLEAFGTSDIDFRVVDEIPIAVIAAHLSGGHNQ